MKVLIIGSGGREHALAWKIAQSPLLTELHAAPGSAAMGEHASCHDIAVSDLDGLVDLARELSIELVVVGPENPLCDGLADRLRRLGIAVFGPSKLAARLETSKAFAKDFYARHNVPSARYGTFSDAAEAKAFLDQFEPPYVLKADGLAAGKGVIVTEDRAEAEAAVRDMLQGNRFGDAGHRVVIEEFLHGEEASFIALVDGENVLALASSQDHKRIFDGDQGPNTGGMGAYSPAPVLTDAVAQTVMQQVMLPTVRGMAAEGRRFVGFLYAGLMISEQGAPRVVEFNVRMGDPETQPIMFRLRSDLLDVIEAALDGRLDQIELDWDPRSSVGVVLAAGGYPDSYAKGDSITGLDAPFEADTKVFHAGTVLDGGQVKTAGGRVLCVCGLGQDLAEARDKVYRAIPAISWDQMQYRRDIGSKGLARTSS